MTRTDILRLVAGAGWVLAIGLIGAERRIIRRLRQGDAVGPGAAIPLNMRSPFARFRLARMRSGGAVGVVEPDRFYLDADGYARYRGMRRRRALTVLTVALSLIVVLWWLDRMR